MNLPVIQGTIDRRILLNYRVDPKILSCLLPPPFRPQMVGGMGIAGICLIRLKAIRPAWLTPAWGWSSENAAHRIAVEWDESGEVRHGVYIPRRDTSSWMNVWVGGRLFPGIHHHARFRVTESEDHLAVAVQSDDGQVELEVVASPAKALPADSIFGSLAEASAFFEAGSLGYSATQESGRFDGLELQCQRWNVQPLQVVRVQSSFFADHSCFPHGSVHFDCALLMRGVRHEWHSHPQLRSGAAVPASCRC